MRLSSKSHTWPKTVYIYMYIHKYMYMHLACKYHTWPKKSTPSYSHYICLYIYIYAYFQSLVSVRLLIFVELPYICNNSHTYKHHAGFGVHTYVIAHIHTHVMQAFMSIQALISIHI